MCVSLSAVYRYCFYLCFFFLWTVLTCDPREPLLWSQSVRGSICGKNRDKSMFRGYNHIRDILTCSWKEEEKGWRGKELRKCAANGNTHKRKKWVLSIFFPPFH